MMTASAVYVCKDFPEPIPSCEQVPKFLIYYDSKRDYIDSQESKFIKECSGNILKDRSKKQNLERYKKIIKESLISFFNNSNDRPYDVRNIMVEPVSESVKKIVNNLEDKCVGEKFEESSIASPNLNNCIVFMKEVVNENGKPDKPAIFRSSEDIKEFFRKSTREYGFKVNLLNSDGANEIVSNNDNLVKVKVILDKEERYYFQLADKQEKEYLIYLSKEND